MDHYTNCGYILGNACDYEPFGHVFRVDEFFQALMAGELPAYKTWIVGQGLSLEEQQFLRRLQLVSPDIHFLIPAPAVSSLFDSPQTALHHLHLIDPYHYQAEVYFSRFHTCNVTEEKLSPAWEVVGNEALYKKGHRLSSDLSRLVEAIEALTVEGLQVSYEKGFIVLKDLKLHQTRKLFPLTVSLEIQLFKAAFANSYQHRFTAKARFYQDNFCLAEATYFVDVETEEAVLAKHELAGSRVFGQSD
jgi:hypothetical protein